MHLSASFVVLAGADGSCRGWQVRLVGRRRLVLDLSCRRRGSDYYVVTDRWQRFSELAVDQGTLETLSASCDEFLVRVPQP